MHKKIRRILFLFIVFLFLIEPFAISSETEKRIERPVRQAIDTRQATQKAQAKWRDDRERLKEKYERLEVENKHLEQQVGELNHQVEATQKRIAKKEKQLADIEQMSSQIGPFVLDLITELKSGLSTGYPFLMAERTQRIEKLDRLAHDPDVPLSEKYRKVMEALLIETEYGFTIETYQETIPMEGQTLLADIFRLGRINLFYQSLDQKHCGFYNVATGTWEALLQKNNLAIRSAVDIAAKRKPVELLTLPMGRLVSQ